MEERGGDIVVEPNVTISNDNFDDTINIPQDELRWCTVSLSEVNDNNQRLEASVFNIDGRHAREVLKRCRWDIVSLWSEKGLIENAYYPTRFKRIYVEKENGIPFFLPSQVSEINPKATKYISRMTNVDFDNLKVKIGQLLLTRSGTIGNCTVVTNTLDSKVFSDDVIRITFKDSIDIGYTYAYLRTKIGSTLLQTNNYGSVVSHIEPEHLRNVPIPNPPKILKSQIHEIVMKSFKLRDESNILLKEAYELLINELKLPPIEKLDIEYFNKQFNLRNYTIKLSQSDYRIDASYHVPIVKAILKYLRENADEVTTVGDQRISKYVKLPGRFKRIYVEEGQGTVFFGGKHIFELDPSNKKFLSVKHHKRQIEELKLVENMVLVTRSGTIGNVNIVPKHWENWVINEHVIRILPSSDDIAGYLYVFLSSDYGLELIKRFTYGSVVDEIDSNHVSNVEVPLLKDKNIQWKINDLALEANKKRYEAYMLEQQAIKMVNDKVIHAEK